MNLKDVCEKCVWRYEKHCVSHISYVSACILVPVDKVKSKEKCEVKGKF